MLFTLSCNHMLYDCMIEFHVYCFSTACDVFDWLSSCVPKDIHNTAVFLTVTLLFSVCLTKYCRLVDCFLLLYSQPRCHSITLLCHRYCPVPCAKDTRTRKLVPVFGYQFFVPDETGSKISGLIFLHYCLTN